MTRPAASETYSALASADWDFAGAPAVDPLHGLHPYPAKFIPDIPRQLISALTRPGDLVLDMFSGGGTTAVEALRSGRRFHAIDANPLAAHITRVKSSAFHDGALSQARSLAALAIADTPTRGEHWTPNIPNQDRWYDPRVFVSLAELRDLIVTTTDGAALDLALLVFANVAAKASYQESETRYVSKPRTVLPATVRAQFARDLLRSAAVLRETDRPANDGIVREGDARDRDNYPTGVSAAITSPPYPNAFDYHLYHRFRLFWLGPGPQSLRRLEIGSHLKHQSEQRPEESYIADMRVVLERTLDALVAGGWFALVVGDGLYKGTIFQTAMELSAVATELGYEVFPTIDRHLPKHRRSFAAAGRRLTQEQILLLRKPDTRARVMLSAPPYALYEYERVLRQRELAVADATQLCGQDAGADIVQVEVDASALPRLQRLAFSAATVLDGNETPTQSALLEGAASGGRRKNSTYLSHGVHKYKGKFYPQLAKSLINASAVQSGGRVLDPFGGSGTAALEATLAGINAISMDCNPVAASTARAKTDILHIEPDDVRRFLRSLTDLTNGSEGSLPRLSAFSDDMIDELTRWFPVPVLTKLNRALTHIRATDDERLANLGEVLVSDIIREVSQQEPKDLRIRRRAEPILDAPVIELLEDRAESLLGKYETYVTRARDFLPVPGVARIVLGDSTLAADYLPQVADALVSSPPYASALPYIDTDRLSLAAVYGYNNHERRPLESTMVGSREIANRERTEIEAHLEDPNALDLPGSTTAWLTAYLEAVRRDPNAGFRRRQAPAVLTRYFVNMAAVLSNAQPRLRPDADVWLVLGDSKSTIGGVKWTIPTADEVLAIAKHQGYEWVESIPITVTREDRLHSRNAIVENQILHLRVGHAQP